MKNQFPLIPVNKNTIYKKGKIHGIGINDSDYQVQPMVDGRRYICLIYRSWKSMIERCYSKKYQKKRPSYIGCTVCDEWLYFSGFRSWAVKQDWEGKCLDKDIVTPGNKIYSPENCVFVTREINSILCDSKKSRGEFPIGVSFCISKNKFQSEIRINNNPTYLGVFDSINKASIAYRKAKSKHLIKIASTQSDKRVAEGLRRHAELLKCHE